MAPNCLTVLAPIRPGEEDALRVILRATGDDVNGRRRSHATAAAQLPYIDFPHSRRIHFARFAILRDPDRGPERARLLYASAFDGDLDAHLAELTAITSDPDAIWGRCEGYGGLATFGAFIRARAQEPAAFYIAFRDESADSIQRAVAARRAQDGSSAGTPRGGGDPPSQLASAWRRLVRAAPILVDMIRALSQYGFGDVYRGTLRIIASLNRYPVFRVVNRLTRNQMPARRGPFTSVTMDSCLTPAPLAPGDEIPALSPSLAPGFREDVVVQNQLTLVTVISPGQANRVRAVMAAIHSYATRLAPPGSLIGISTIHFVRWLVIDGGRRLMMVSDYDGSWENYIDEFAEMIVSGLDAIWETAIGAPPDGARDLPAFKRFLRTHQVASDAFFSAYPNATVLNILSDTTRTRIGS
jgi:hypothetical protein